MSPLSNAFIACSLHYLRNDYLPKIRRCLEQLSEDDIWWRPHAHSNSIGNLVLHLCGNARQWIVSGIGKVPDVRDRQGEFDAQGPMPVSELSNRLTTTLDEIAGVLQAINPEDLLETLTIQGNRVTVFEAIYHVVEHFSTHTGQIIYITKMRTGADLGFYRTTGEGHAFPTWT